MAAAIRTTRSVSAAPRASAEVSGRRARSRVRIESIPNSGRIATNHTKARIKEYHPNDCGPSMRAINAVAAKTRSLEAKLATSTMPEFRRIDHHRLPRAQKWKAGTDAIPILCIVGEALHLEGRRP